MKKELGIEFENDTKSKLPEEEVTGFCLWLKDCLKSKIKKVQLSKRLTNTPAIIVGDVSSSMYMMMQMLQASGQMGGNG
jgi:HSP90 family molecular chaperone